MFGKKRKSRQSRRKVTVSPYSRNSHAPQSALSPQARRWVKVGMAAVLTYLFVAGNMGAWRLVSLWRIESDLEHQEDRLLAEIISLDTRQQMLKSDTTYIENLARTEFNLQRSDETVYLIDDSAP
jgi:cell division protein FtsB